MRTGNTRHAWAVTLSTVAAAQAFAGDVVVVTDAKGAVRITGSPSDDQVRVELVPDQPVLRVVPQAGTTVNGGGAAVEVPLTGSVRVALGAGDDALTMPDVLGQLDFPGKVRIDMGPGAATVLLQDAVFPDGIDVRLPLGGGSVTVRNCVVVAGDLRLRASNAVAPLTLTVADTEFGSGSMVAEGARSSANVVRVSGSEFSAGGITWSGGEVDDDVAITNVNATGRLSITPGLRGTHRTSLVSGGFDGGGRIAGGAGDDFVTVTGTDFFTKGLAIDGGRGGTESVTVSESLISGALALRFVRSAGSVVRLTGPTIDAGGRIDVQGSRGVDDVQLETVSCGGALGIVAGTGDDRLRVDGSTFAGTFRVDGGAGDDRLCDGYDALNSFGAARSVVRVESDRRASEGDDASECGDGTRRASIPRISLTKSGGDANGPSRLSADRTNRVLEEDGEAVVYQSTATNLVAGDTNGGSDIFVASIVNDVLVERVSLRSDGGQFTRDGRGAAPSCANPSMSAQARFVAFESTAADAVDGDVNGEADVFLRDRLFGTTVAVSDPFERDDGQGGTYYLRGAFDPSISGEGRDVAFVSYANFLATGPEDRSLVDSHVWVAYYSFDGTVFRRRATVRSDGSEPDVAFGFSGHPSLSFRGEACAFESSIQLTPDAPGPSQYKVYVRSFVQPATTELISVTATGQTFAAFKPTISDDGNLVAFLTSAALAPGDTNGTQDVYVKNRTTGEITWASPPPAGGFPSLDPPLSQAFLAGGGRFVVFSASGQSVRPNEATFFHRDIYLFDRTTGVTVETGTGAAGEARGDTRTPSLTPNGRWLAFTSVGGDFDAEIPDGNFDFDVWVQDRGAGAVAPPPSKR